MADPIIECERCHRKYQVSAQYAGKAIRCRNCDHVIPIPRGPERRPFVAQRAVPVVDVEVVGDDEAEGGTETVEEHVAASHTSGLSSRERRRERRRPLIRWLPTSLPALVAAGRVHPPARVRGRPE